MASLPKHILKSALENTTSLGDNPCLPPDEENKFLIALLSNRYEQIKNNVSGNIDSNVLKQDLSDIVVKCKSIEKNNLSSLEKIVVNIVMDLFRLPEDTIEFEVKLVDKVNIDHERLIPEKTDNDFSFEDIDEMNYLTSEIYKRRVLNALITGASLWYVNNIKLYLSDIFDINPDLPSLYKKLMNINDALIFITPDSIKTENTSEGGNVDVYLGSKLSMTKIKAEGVVFPILLFETIKGVMEIAISHGLPTDIQKAQYIISKADFRLAENWDTRVGYPLWERLVDVFESVDCDINEIGVNFILMEIASLKPDNFNTSLQEMLAKTKKGKQIASSIADKIQYNRNKQEFDDYINTKRSEEVPINDDLYFSPGELITDGEEY